MAEAKGLRVVGYFDCPGGGQVVVRNNVAYIGHVIPPDGTTIIDVADPAKPRWLAHIQPYLPPTHQIIGALRLTQPALWLPLGLGAALPLQEHL